MHPLHSVQQVYGVLRVHEVQRVLELHRLHGLQHLLAVHQELRPLRLRRPKQRLCVGERRAKSRETPRGAQDKTHRRRARRVVWHRLGAARETLMPATSPDPSATVRRRAHRGPRGATILHGRFRVSPLYDLVSFEALSAGDRDMVGDLISDTGFFGVLRPKPGARLGTKSATHALAALLRHVRRTSALPARIRQPRSGMKDEITRLVLDGILEVAHQGAFVTGARANHLCAPARKGNELAHPLLRLSQDALAYGVALELGDPATLSARMYFYNRLPVAPRWANQLSSEEKTAQFLGVTVGTGVRMMIDQHWRPSMKDDSGGWLLWVPTAGSRPRNKHGATHKLYVSPTVDQCRGVLESVVRVLGEHPNAKFKVGADVYGLLRPDKIVVYFDSLDELQRAASRLTRELSHIAPHGIPFTTPIDDRGLLSRGVDPPESSKLLSWRETESWRLWTTNRLAVYLLAAKATGAPSNGAAIAFALARLRLDGVDTDTWAPDAAAWVTGPAETS